MTIVFLAQDPAMLKAVKPHHGEFTVTKIEKAPQLPAAITC